MRSLKIRAWNRSEKKMVYLGGGVGDNIIDVFLVELDQKGEPSWTLGTGDYDWVVAGGADSKDNDILMFATGLKDKNGKEIYEGDIVGLVHKKNGLVNKQTVIWNNDSASFDWETTNNDSWPDSFSGFMEEYEVIGNIYENKELIK